MDYCPHSCPNQNPKSHSWLLPLSHPHLQSITKSVRQYFSISFHFCLFLSNLFGPTPAIPLLFTLVRAAIISHPDHCSCPQLIYLQFSSTPILHTADRNEQSKINFWSCHSLTLHCQRKTTKFAACIRLLIIWPLLLSPALSRSVLSVPPGPFPFYRQAFTYQLLKSYIISLLWFCLLFVYPSRMW